MKLKLIVNGKIKIEYRVKRQGIVKLNNSCIGKSKGNNKE